MAELLIGRHTHRNMVQALESLPDARPLKLAGKLTGLAGLLTASLILSFYAIVAGWMLGFSASYPLGAAGLMKASEWLVAFTPSRNLFLMLGFMGLTMAVVLGGVENGIERWSRRLMPLLIATLIALAAYVLTLTGAHRTASLSATGSRQGPLRRLASGRTGQRIFLLITGCGHHAHIWLLSSDQENVPRVGAQVALVDVGIAVLAGFLILPAMYVADARGVAIFSESGGLLSEDTLIFSVLPALFETMSTTGVWLATAFFLLMSVAALTSSISMLEVPVAYLIEQFELSRRKATLLAGISIALFSALVVLNFDALFGLVITVSTRYSQPILGIAVCVFAGWIWHRDALLRELNKNDTNAVNGLFWRIWPFYVKYFCPAIIGIIVIQSIL